MKQTSTNEQTYPAFITPADCITCQHLIKMGYELPAEDITLSIAADLCPNCRRQLPFEKLHCPITREHMEALIAYLLLSSCHHTHARVIDFCHEEGIPALQLIGWLQEHGGHCDCEVVNNIATTWFPDVPLEPF